MHRCSSWSWKPVWIICGAIVAAGLFQQHARGTGVFRQDGPVRLAGDLASYYLRKAGSAVETAFNNDVVIDAASLNQVPSSADRPLASQPPSAAAAPQFSSSPFTCAARHDFGCPPCYGPQAYGW